MNKALYLVVSILISLALVVSGCTAEEAAHVIIDNLDEIPAGPAGADGATGADGAPGSFAFNEPGAANNFLTGYNNSTGAWSKAQPTIDNVTGLQAALNAKENLLRFNPG